MGENIKEIICRYLYKSRINRKDTKFPPTGEEIENLISFLTVKGLNPIIVGSLAVVKHLKLTCSEIENNLFPPTEQVEFSFSSQNDSFRATQDVYVNKSLPPPLEGWRRDMRSIGVTSWVSPSGGFVDFLVSGGQLPGGCITVKTVNKDPESINTGWPIADIASIFLLKLNSPRDKDLIDLVVLARKVGIPKLPDKLNQMQSENLETIKLWLEYGGLLK